MPYSVSDWSLAVSNALSDIITRVINFIPALIGAAIIVIIGWIVAAFLEWVVDNVLRAVGLQTLFEKVRVEDVIKKADSRKDTTALVAAGIKWIIMLVSFVAAAQVLGLPQGSSFLDRLVSYSANVIGAALTLLVGAIFAHFLAKVVRGSAQAAKLSFADLAGSVTKYAILGFAIIAALSQLGIATIFLQTLFTGLVALLAIAGGLAFGLGGQSAAKEIVDKVRKEVEVK